MSAAAKRILSAVLLSTAVHGLLLGAVLWLARPVSANDASGSFSSSRASTVAPLPVLLLGDAKHVSEPTRSAAAGPAEPTRSAAERPAEPMRAEAAQRREGVDAKMASASTVRSVERDASALRAARRGGRDALSPERDANISTRLSGGDAVDVSTAPAERTSAESVTTSQEAGVSTKDASAQVASADSSPRGSVPATTATASATSAGFATTVAATAAAASGADASGSTTEGLETLQRRLAVAAAQCYPLQARRFRLRGQVFLRFLLEDGGLARDVSLEGSTGSTVLDVAARECVLKKAAPLPVRPGRYRVLVRFE